MAIEIKFLSNVVRFLKGTNDMEEALDDVADTLDDVAKDAKKAGDKTGDALTDAAKDAKRAGDKIGDEISDGAKDAEQSVERLERTFKDMADTARRETGDASDAMRSDMRDGATGASEAVTEFGDEAVQNMSETFSSFRGEAEDFAQIAQDTFGGVISALGPVGMAAGAAGAIGIGMIMASLEEGEEAAQDMRDRVGELAGQLIEIGGDPVAQLDAIVEGLKDLASESEEGETSLADLRAAAEGSATGFQRLADAYAGNTEGLRDMLEAEKERLAAAETSYNQDKRWDQEKTKNLRDQRDGLRTIVDGLEKASTAAEEAEAEEAAWLASNGPAYEAKAEAIDSLQGELNDAIGSYGDFIDAETGATDPAGYLAAMQARMDATANFNSNVQDLASRFGLSHDEVQAILDKGLDFAPMLQDLINGGYDEQYVEQLRAMLDGGQSIVDGTPITAKMTGEADTEGAVSALEAASADRDTTIKGSAETRTAARDLDGVADKKRTAKITAKAQTTLASSALRSVARNRTAKITAQASTWAAEQALNRLTRARTVQVTADVRTREGKPVP
ncbi:hypothetical protein [Leucobacter triazinivorans]|uniref:Uncharacterized protein n=1 Tax=Leucobacter triazinivorans TaxID=1784719 RepID=A0A4P6KFM0_9MICO|nr:hypothetical protein [Leucobacter triazinivorans]QBE48748.1 hypothetical protein EVS81_07815 [Leucobacter triazinivorans]